MAMTVHCDIVSAEKTIFSGLVEMIIASSHEGDVGVMYGHAPLLTSLVPGPIRIIKQGGEEEVYYVSGGYLEVQPDNINIIADSAQRADDIYEAAAKKAQEAAINAINNQAGEFDYAQVSLQLAEAAARLRAIQQLRRR